MISSSSSSFDRRFSLALSGSFPLSYLNGRFWRFRGVFTKDVGWDEVRDIDFHFLGADKEVKGEGRRTEILR